MMEAKHTPGPWIVDDWQYSVPGREHVPTIVNGRDAVAEACPLWHEVGEDREPERKANAALIAAAPDLVEALESVRSNMQAISETNRKWTVNDQRVYEIVETAIVKAQGGQQ